jgi:murein DD-endopeptidase MepM/ murein hydrolase activator NlpD
MKTLLGIVMTATLLAGCTLGCIIVMYTAGTLAAAETARRAIPVVGGEVGDRIERWALGAYEPETIDYLAPLEGSDAISTPLPGTPEPMMTPPPDAADCARPRGLPVEGYISQGFHAGHPGIDIAGHQGDVVRSTMCGQVTYAGWSDIGYGFVIDVSNGSYLTRYAHMLPNLNVSKGEWVTLNDLLGMRGSTGNSTGPHVHYETWSAGARVNPLTQFP